LFISRDHKRYLVRLKSVTRCKRIAASFSTTIASAVPGARDEDHLGYPFLLLDPPPPI
jgi:hypothetical protein